MSLHGYEFMTGCCLVFLLKSQSEEILIGDGGPKPSPRYFLFHPIPLITCLVHLMALISPRNWRAGIANVGILAWLISFLLSGDGRRSQSIINGTL